MRGLGLLLFCGIAFASNVEFYKAGYEKGYEEGYKAGIERAIQFFKEVYQEKLKEYQELEAGKLLLKEQRISYPRVYQVITPEGGTKVMVEGCKIIAPVDDLLHRITSVRNAPLQREEKVLEKVSLFQKQVKVVLPESALEDLQKIPQAVFFRKDGELHAFLTEEQARRICQLHPCKGGGE